MYDIISLVIGIFFVIFSVIMLNNIDIIKERTVTGRYSSYTFKRSSAKLHLIILMIIGILLILFNILLNGLI